MNGWIGYGPKDSETEYLWQYLKSLRFHSKASIKMPIYSLYYEHIVGIPSLLNWNIFRLARALWNIRALLLLLLLIFVHGGIENLFTKNWLLQLDDSEFLSLRVLHKRQIIFL